MLTLIYLGHSLPGEDSLCYDIQFHNPMKLMLLRSKDFCLQPIIKVLDIES